MLTFIILASVVTILCSHRANIEGRVMSWNDITYPITYVGNFVDALQRLTMHWYALMQHVHYDAL